MAVRFIGSQFFLNFFDDRYIELKVTMESTETVEEIMEYIAGVTQYKEGSKNETVEADQITSASQEERKR